MSLKPEVSLGVGLATGVLVWSIYSHAMPALVDHRAGDPDDMDAAAAERVATWTAAGVVAGISLIAKDPVVFMVGGTMVVALSLWHRHANMVNPLTGRATAQTVALPEDASPQDAYVEA